MSEGGSKKVSNKGRITSFSERVEVGDDDKVGDVGAGPTIWIAVFHACL